MFKALKRYINLLSSFLWKTNSVNKQEFYELLFKTHAPKALGFIMQYTNNNKEGEKYLKLVFLKVRNDLKNIDENTDKKILYHILCVCKPLYKRGTIQNIKTKSNHSLYN